MLSGQGLRALPCPGISVTLDWRQRRSWTYFSDTLPTCKHSSVVGLLQYMPLHHPAIQLSLHPGPECNQESLIPYSIPLVPYPRGRLLSILMGEIFPNPTHMNSNTHSFLLSPSVWVGSILSRSLRQRPPRDSFTPFPYLELYNLLFRCHLWWPLPWIGCKHLSK